MVTDTDTLIPSAARYFVERQSDLQWDAMTLETVPRDLWADEAALYQTKFWDYRLIHPSHATALFAQAYGVAYSRFQARRTGLAATNFTPLNSREWNPFEEAPARVRAFWKARQFCDELGMPYDDYCACYMSVADEYYENPPRPQEMYRVDTAGVVVEWWEERRASGVITYPRNEHFQLRDNWCGSPHQMEWEEFSKRHMLAKPIDVRELALKWRAPYYREEVANELLGV